MSLRPAKGFTLVEILIVVVILGILAAIVIPRYSSAANESRFAAIADQLRMLRGEINVYRAQHNDTWPGVTAVAPSGSPDLFVAHLTGITDANSDVAATPDATHKFGPYLSSMPPNPMSGLASVKYDLTFDDVPAADNTTGWIYQPYTGRISLNQTGTDLSGKAFVTY